MRFIGVTFLVLGVGFHTGVFGSQVGLRYSWSQNIAPFAECQDTKLNDDNAFSVGETSRAEFEKQTALTKADQDEEENFIRRQR